MKLFLKYGTERNKQSKTELRTKVPFPIYYYLFISLDNPLPSFTSFSHPRLAPSDYHKLLSSGQSNSSCVVLQVS